MPLPVSAARTGEPTGGRTCFYRQEDGGGTAVATPPSPRGVRGFGALVRFHSLF